MKQSASHLARADRHTLGALIEAPLALAPGSWASANQTLLNVDDSVLVVIDVQRAFLDKLPIAESTALVSRIRWLVQASVSLGVPIVATAEDIPRLGSVVDDVRSVMPPATAIHNKMVFGLASVPGIVTAVETTGRRTAVLVGLETDVCVAHSGIGLLELDYRVAVLSDCTGSPHCAHEAGLRRLDHAGATVLPMRSLLHEWLRTVERSRRFHAEVIEAIGYPDGIVF